MIEHKLRRSAQLSLQWEMALALWRTMRKKLVRILAVLVPVAVAGWLGFREAGHEPSATRRTQRAESEAVRGAESGRAGTLPAGETSTPPMTPPDVSLATERTAAPAGGALLQEWLTSSQDVAEIADTILRGWPRLKTDDQAMVAKELIPLVTDDRYQGLRRLLLDPDTSAAAKELIFRNLILRPKDLHLPLFLAVLQQSPRHPCAEEARNLLIVRLGADYGTDWAKWQARINEELSP